MPNLSKLNWLSSLGAWDTIDLPEETTTFTKVIVDLKENVHNLSDAERQVQTSLHDSCGEEITIRDDDGCHQLPSPPHDAEASSDIRFADSEELEMIKDGSNGSHSLEPLQEKFVREIRYRSKYNRKRSSTSCRLCSSCVTGTQPIRKGGLEDHIEHDDTGRGAFRKLIIDKKKNISVNEMKAQLSDTADIVSSLHLAPQTKRVKYLIETGEVNKLFALPGRPIHSGSLLRDYERKLRSKPIYTDDFDSAPEGVKIFTPLYCEIAPEMETMSSPQTSIPPGNSLLMQVVSDHQQAALLEENSHPLTAPMVCIFGENDTSTTALPVIEENEELSKLRTVAEEGRKKKEMDWIQQFNLRDCYVKLRNIIILSKRKYESEESNSFSKIKSPGEAVPFARPRTLESSKTRQSTYEARKEIQVLHNRMKFMEEKARIADGELKRIKLDKDSCQKQISEMTRKKTETEFDLRKKQCEAVKLNLSLLDCFETEGKADTLSCLEEMIKKLEGVVEGMDFQLEALGKEDVNLSENVEDAVNSYHGIIQVLEALKSELKSLEVDYSIAVIPGFV